MIDYLTLALVLVCLGLSVRTQAELRRLGQEIEDLWDAIDGDEDDPEREPAVLPENVIAISRKAA